MIDDSLFVARGSGLTGIERQVVLSASPKQVFDALASEEGVRAFLGAKSSIDLRIGGAYEIYFDDDMPPGQRGSEGCQVMAYVPDRMLAISWNAPPQLAQARLLRAWVVFLIDEAELGGSRVEMRHVGFGEGGEWPEVRTYFERAWGMFLDRLVSHFDAPPA